LNGAFRVDDPSANIPLGPNAAAALATSLVTVTGTDPLQNKADLVRAMAKTMSTTVKVDGNDTLATDLYPSIKTQREAPIRALADVANTRTWNLLIDVIAQTGQFVHGASKLDQFVVTGERRYWLHVAIDRFTGMIIDEQLEPVYE
jgi:hypothetical protein